MFINRKSTTKQYMTAAIQLALIQNRLIIGAKSAIIEYSWIISINVWFCTGTRLVLDNHERHQFSHSWPPFLLQTSHDSLRRLSSNTEGNAQLHFRLLHAFLNNFHNQRSNALRTFCRSRFRVNQRDLPDRAGRFIETEEAIAEEGFFNKRFQLLNHLTAAVHAGIRKLNLYMLEIVVHGPIWAFRQLTAERSDGRLWIRESCRWEWSFSEQG